MFIYPEKKERGEHIVQKMYEQGIYIGYEKNCGAVYISPLNLTDEEADIVGNMLRVILLAE